MKKISVNKSDILKVEEFLRENSDKPIYVVYNEIKSKKAFKRTKAEHLVFTYLNLNKRKLGIKWLI